MTTPHVYTAMIAVKKRISALGLSKGRSAPAVMGGFAFRGIDDLYNLVCGIEAEENLMVLPRIVSERTEYQTTDKGKLQTHVHLTMELKFVSAIDGSSDIASALGEGIDSGDKASGKAQSNAMKQAHLEVYKVPTEGEGDVEAYAEQVGSKAERDLVPALQASVAWGDWEVRHAKALKSSTSMGELQEAWSVAYAEGDKKAPNGTMKRLVLVKDEMKSALSKNGTAASP